MPPLRPQTPNFFAGPFVDRRADVREAEGGLAQARQDPGTRYLVCAGSQHLLHETGRRIAFLDAAHPVARQATPEQLVLLGQFNGAWCILIDAPPETCRLLPPGTALRELRPLAPELDAAEAALLAYAQALIQWRRRQRFCPLCGTPTRPARAGHAMVCGNPAEPHEIFPRIDPAIIVLVSDGGHALLGRQPSWPPGRYSTIAGFVEPGESLEDAVAREVREETGVGVASCQYHSSQPWPFPASLMLGFHATASAETHIRVGGELEDARWFSRDEIAAGRIQLPPPHAISHRLITAWLHSRDAAG